MDNLIFSINVVLPMFLMMCLGFLLKKFKMYDDNFLAQGNKLVFKVFMSIMLFNNIYKSDFISNFNLKLVSYILGGLFILFAIAVVSINKIEKDDSRKGVLIQAIFRSNFVIFGLPMSINIFGENSIGTMSMLIAFVVPVFNFLSVIILEIYSKKADNIKLNIGDMVIDIMKNPLILGSLLGIIASILNVRLPQALDKTVSDIAKIATPLALIFLGGSFELGHVIKYKKYIIGISFVKLIVVPSIAIGFALIIGMRGFDIGAVMAVFAPPIAVASYTMAQQVHADSDLAGVLVASTTMLSSITIFIMVFGMKSLEII